MPHLPSTPTVVLLASVLKPLDDTRMYGKFAQTLAQRPTWQIHVAGRGRSSTGQQAEFSGIGLHGLFESGRLSLARLWAQACYWQLLARLRPDMVIVHAPELLPLTLLWQWLRPGRRQFLYDIRENYALNVTTQHVYGGLVRRALAAGLRWVEKWATRRAAGVILAEQSYAAELPFLLEQPAGRVVVLENKYQPAAGEVLPAAGHPLPGPDEPLRLLYSGTISELNGVFAAIDFTRQLRRHWPQAHLTIVGFCQRPEQLARLHQAIAAADGAVTLVGGSALVPHARIVAEIRRSHLGLLPYRPHQSTWRCLPTKLYEYLAHALPVLIPANGLWQEVVERQQAGLVVDFEGAENMARLTQQLQTRAFYPLGAPSDALWATEATKLWRLMDSIR